MLLSRKRKNGEGANGKGSPLTSSTEKRDSEDLGLRHDPQEVPEMVVKAEGRNIAGETVRYFKTMWLIMPETYCMRMCKNDHEYDLRNHSGDFLRRHDCWSCAIASTRAMMCIWRRLSHTEAVSECAQPMHK